MNKDPLDTLVISHQEAQKIPKYVHISGRQIYDKKHFNKAGHHERDFYDLVELMWSALMKVESENMTMEQISSAAHICALVSFKLLETKHA